MLNFESMDKRYRERIYYATEDLLDKMITDYLIKGGQFDAQKITKFFGTACRIAQLCVDLEIGTGLNPLRGERIDEDTNRETPCDKQGGCQSFTRDETAKQSGPRLTELVEDEVSDLGTRDTQGPPGCVGNASGVCDSECAADQADDNGPTGGGEIDAPQQQPVPAESRSREGRGHSGGPESPTIHPTSGD